MSTSGAKIHPVILSGGSGTRLWPLSRSLYPKQLLPVAEASSMMQATAARVSDVRGFAAPIIVTGEDHRFLVADQLSERGLQPAAILLEPEGRNTAPAIALAAYQVVASDPDGLILVMPSDHVIRDVGAFHEAVARLTPAAEAGRLAMLGIAPDRAETGYGYIKLGDELAGTPGVCAVAEFVEKPDAPTAERYLSSGSYVWNGGIFLFRATDFLQELSTHAPKVTDACSRAMDSATRDRFFVRPDADAFRAAPNISVDYAVMEQTSRACVTRVNMQWSDVGSWDALWEISGKDASSNAAQGEVVAVDTKGSLLRAEGGPLIAAVGVENMIVVSTRDAVLIAPRERAQDVKRVVDELKARGSEMHRLQAVVHRPWGTYETTDRGERFQTKRIVVKPGQQLSLQMHHHRSEHWIVVSGTARVTIGGEVILLQENQSTYIPAGTTHRLENPGRIPLHLIEVQCGPYLGEDDIVRFEDTYGRAGTSR